MRIPIIDIESLNRVSLPLIAQASLIRFLEFVFVKRSQDATQVRLSGGAELCERQCPIKEFDRMAAVPEYARSDVAFCRTQVRQRLREFGTCQALRPL